MATKRPSFLKRQKEMKRTARALEKREARKERKGATKPPQEDFAATPDEAVSDQVFDETENVKDVEP
jgi:ribosomal protein S25